jgi:hypothetical protein
VGVDNGDDVRTTELGSYGPQLPQLVVDIVDQRLDSCFGICIQSDLDNKLQLPLHGVT